MLPLVPLYAAGVALRWAGAKPKRLGRPVISVGNLSTGGTGKTPFTIALAALLKSEGAAVDVLSRGYGRTGGAAATVDPTGGAEEFGDEPLLIAREAGVSVYVAARRWEAGRLAEASGDAVDVHLLDDGFQHRQLSRDVDIVLVNSQDLSDRLLPAGNLREPVSALRRATVVAVPAGDDAAVARLRGLGIERPVWRFQRGMTVPEVSGQVVAFCGIARPEQFFSGIERAGVAIAARRVFRDHHLFSTKDMEGLRAIARETKAVALLTTAKDKVRLGPMAELERELPLLTVGLEVSFEEPAAVAAWLLARLGGR